MGANDIEVDLESWRGKFAITKKRRILFVIFGKREKVVDVSHLAEMRANRLKKDKMQVNVTFYEI
jgi:hypothetical protein